MDLSIIIVNYNVYNDIIQCIKSIYEHLKGLKFEIIVIDNCSFNRDIEELNNIYPEVNLILLNNNNGFGFANNIGMKASSGKYFLLLNPDIIIQDNSIYILFETLEKYKNAAVVGPVQYKPGSGLEYYYTFFPSLYSRFTQEFGLYMKTNLMKKRFYSFLDSNIARGVPFKVDWVIGSSMMVRKEIFELTGGFDEAFFLYEEETEWQYRIKKMGYDILMVPEAKVIHNHHSSTSKIGVMFILFQEYRSRIIFDIKRNEKVFSFARRLMVVNSIIFRLIYFSIFNFQSFEIFRNRISLYLSLLKLNLSFKENVRRNRFIFSDFNDLFFNTGNAKL